MKIPNDVLYAFIFLALGILNYSVNAQAHPKRKPKPGARSLSATTNPFTIPVQTQPPVAVETPLCREDGFGVSIRNNSFDFANVTLADPSCIATSNSTHINLWSNFSNCGSNKTETNDHIVVTNKIIIVEEPSGIITRAKTIVIPFSCKYSRREWQSMVSFRPTVQSVLQAHENGFGNFSLYFRMASSALFGSYYSSYPVRVEINDRIYFEVSLKNNDTGPDLLVEKCFVTPSADRNDATKYKLIHNRCANDSTLQFHRGASHHKRFSFLAFNFAKNVPVIFLHCEVFLCQSSSTDSRCRVNSCSSINILGRKKRDIEKREITDTSGISESYMLDNGPIKNQNLVKNNENSKGASSSSVSTSTTVMGLVIGFLVLVLMGVVVAKLIKFRKKEALKAMVTVDNEKKAQDNIGFEMQS